MKYQTQCIIKTVSIATFVIPYRNEQTNVKSKQTIKQKCINTQIQVLIVCLYVDVKYMKRGELQKKSRKKTFIKKIEIMKK